MSIKYVVAPWYCWHAALVAGNPAARQSQVVYDKILLHTLVSLSLLTVYIIPTIRAVDSPPTLQIT